GQGRRGQKGFDQLYLVKGPFRAVHQIGGHHLEGNFQASKIIVGKEFLKNGDIALRGDETGFVDGEQTVFEQRGLPKEVEHALHGVPVGVEGTNQGPYRSATDPMGDEPLLFHGLDQADMGHPTDPSPGEHQAYGFAFEHFNSVWAKVNFWPQGKCQGAPNEVKKTSIYGSPQSGNGPRSQTDRSVNS